ncbi:MFS transporter [Cohnella cholangitidis]|uniref:MFS transporter n=1 Tax=Cohnella cholangitidis TaxID=2598458 RepID=A0A7G5C376_9BACL|nr:MFS transporter [Cohnella cholangitidis]QMV43660.1 MFS transporter [Cohnella cholangitidis]
MSKEMRKLLVMNAISSIIAIYIGIFVNLYIWEHSHSIAEVSLYNMSMFISWGISFAITAKLLARFSIRLPLAVSALCGAAAFMYLVSAELDNRILWILILGIPVGAMFGFSQASQNLSIALRGKGSEYAPYFATMMVISQVLSMAVPFVSAKVIDWQGYAGSFGLMLIFVAVMLAFSAFMPKISLADRMSNSPEPAVKFRFRTAFGRPGSKWILLSLLTAGIFMQFQNLFTLLFTFSVTQDKLLIALLNMVYTCCSLLGLWMYRKIKLDEMRWLWIGMSLLAVGFIIVLFRHPAALILSNLLTSIGMFYFTTVWNAQQFRFIHHASPVSLTSFLVWREGLLVATRCVLLGLTLPLKDMGGTGFALIIGVTVICLLSIPVFQQKAIQAAALNEEKGG